MHLSNNNVFVFTNLQGTVAKRSLFVSSAFVTASGAIFIRTHEVSIVSLCHLGSVDVFVVVVNDGVIDRDTYL